jgi:hypothetical protein
LHLSSCYFSQAFEDRHFTWRGISFGTLSGLIPEILKRFQVVDDVCHGSAYAFATMQSGQVRDFFPSADGQSERGAKALSPRYIQKIVVMQACMRSVANEQGRETRFVIITGGRFAIRLNPFRMLRAERIVHLALKLGITRNFSDEE